MPFFEIKTEEIQFFFASSEKKAKGLMARTVQYLGMTRTVLLNCPIKAEIRAVDSQSDLRIFYDLLVILTLYWPIHPDVLSTY